MFAQPKHNKGRAEKALLAFMTSGTNVFSFPTCTEKLKSTHFLRWKKDTHILSTYAYELYVLLRIFCSSELNFKRTMSLIQKNRNDLNILQLQNVMICIV